MLICYCPPVSSPYMLFAPKVLYCHHCPVFGLRPAQVSSEALANIRTIAGLAKESMFVDLYEKQLVAPYRAAKKKAIVYGICFAFAQCVIFMTYAASFRYGGYLVNNEGLHYMLVFRYDMHIKSSAFINISIKMLIYLNLKGC